jgi:hypothetical protein
MTIRFAQALNLKGLLAKVYSYSPDEILTATSCVLLRQLAFNKTQLTSIEPRRAIFRREFIHQGADEGGMEGIELLIDQKELKERLDRLVAGNTGSLTLKTERGRLVLKADYYVSASGAERQRASSTIRQYPGPTSDFGPLIDFEGDSIVSVSADEFNQAVFLLDSFAGLSNEKPFEGDAANTLALVEIDRDRLTLSASFKSAYLAYAQLSIPVCANNLTAPMKFAIEGRQLKRLSGLGGSKDLVDVYITKDGDDEEAGEEWVTFAGPAGSTSLRMYPLNVRLRQDTVLFNDHPDLSSYATRLPSIDEMVSAVIIQQPSNSDPQQDLLLMEKSGQMVVLQSGKVGDFDQAVAPFDPVNSEGSWAPVLINSKTLLSSLKLVKTYLGRLKIQSANAVMNQKILTFKKGGKSWVLYVKPAMMDGIELNFLLQCSLATPDQINTDE